MNAWLCHDWPSCPGYNKAGVKVISSVDFWRRRISLPIHQLVNNELDVIIAKNIHRINNEPFLALILLYSVMIRNLKNCCFLYIIRRQRRKRKDCRLWCLNSTVRRAPFRNLKLDSPTTLSATCSTPGTVIQGFSWLNYKNHLDFIYWCAAALSLLLKRFFRNQRRVLLYFL